MKKVVLIEDNRILSKVLTEELHDAGFEVSSAFDGATGLDLIQDEKPDLILLDLLIPNLDGLSLLKKVKENTESANIPVIILTNSDDSQDISRAMVYGAQSYIIKSSKEVIGITEKVKEVLGESP